MPGISMVVLPTSSHNGVQDANPVGWLNLHTDQELAPTM